MKRGREIRNLPAINVTSGKIIGVVQDLAITADQKIIGLYIRLESKELRLLPLEHLVNIGRDAVLVQGEELELAVVTETDYNRSSAGAWVMTAEGKSLGTIDDIVVEDNAGSIVGYEISDGLIMDMLAGRKIVDATNILTFGSDTIIVAKDS